MRRAKILLLGYLGTIGAIVLIALLGLAFSPTVERDLDTYYEAYWNTVDSFDPCRAYDTVSSLMLDQVVEGLYEYDGDRWDYTIIPGLAADMPDISEDGRVYTVRLRPNVRYPAAMWDPDDPDQEVPVEPWRDEPRYVKADDFVFAFKRLCDFHNASPHFAGTAQDRIIGATEFFEATERRDKYSWYYDDLDIPGVRALDDLTLQIELDAPYPQLIYKLMGFPLGPMPKEYYRHYAVTLPTEKHNRENPDDRRTFHQRRDIEFMMLGTGPYRLKEYQRERFVKFDLNEMYRGRPEWDGNPSGLGGVDPSKPRERTLPYSVKKQEYRYSRNAMARWFNFSLGVYDKIQQIPKDKFGAAIEGGEISPALAQTGMKQKIVPWPSVEYMAFHMKEEMFARNKPLRQAMSLAIDRVQYNKQFRNSEEMVPQGFVPPGSFTYDADYLAPFYRYDPEEAARLAQEAKRLHREMFGKDMPAFTASFRSTASATKQAAEYLKLAWRNIGIDVELEFYDFGKWLENLRARNYQVNNAGWVGDYPDEETFLALFYSRNYAGGGQNSTGFSNAEYDALYEQAKTMLDSPERRELYVRMARIIEEECPVFLLYYRTRREFYFDWLGDISPHVYLRAQPAYYRLDGELREARLNGELEGTLEELKEEGLWLRDDHAAEGAQAP